MSVTTLLRYCVTVTKCTHHGRWKSDRRDGQVCIWLCHRRATLAFVASQLHLERDKRSRYIANAKCRHHKRICNIGNTCWNAEFGTRHRETDIIFLHDMSYTLFIFYKSHVFLAQPGKRDRDNYRQLTTMFLNFEQISA